MKIKVNKKNMIIIGLFLVVVLLSFFDSSRYTVSKMYKTLNEQRSIEVGLIVNKISLYYNENNTFPKAIWFKWLQESYPWLNNDVKYHYDYLSDGINYLFTYPFESYEWIICMKKSNNLSEYTEKEINDKCDETLKRKRKGE